MSDYLAHPKFKPIGGVFVLHAWWGLNEFFRGFCDRLGAKGFTVLAPDLYEGAVASAIPEARKLRAAVNRDAESKHVLQALKQLRSNVEEKPIALIGFSMGAFWALKLLEENPGAFAATVLFYGTRGGEYAGAQSAFLGHFAENDEYVADSAK